MSLVKASQSVTVFFSTNDPSTGAATNADSTPTGTLYENGSDTGQTVTVSNVTTGLYTAAFTLPSDASDEDVYDLVIAATVGGTTGRDSVWRGSVESLVWASGTRTLTQAAASVTAAVSGDTITVYRGTFWSISLTGLGDLSNYDTIYLSVKSQFSDSDDDAILRVKDDASGLERFNKASPTNAANGTITIDDVNAGDITATVDEVETQNAPVANGYNYDVKAIDSDGEVNLLSVGEDKWNISGDVTRAIT